MLSNDELREIDTGEAITGIWAAMDVLHASEHLDINADLGEVVDQARQSWSPREEVTLEETIPVERDPEREAAEQEAREEERMDEDLDRCADGCVCTPEEREAAGMDATLAKEDRRNEGLQ